MKEDQKLLNEEIERRIDADDEHERRWPKQDDEDEASRRMAIRLQRGVDKLPGGVIRGGCFH
jgi:hypothetical protein